MLPEFNRKRKFEVENRNGRHNSTKLQNLYMLQVQNLAQTTLDLTTGFKRHKTTILGNHMFQRKGTRVPTIDKMETRKKTTVAKVLETVLGVLFGSPKGMIIDSEVQVGLIMLPDFPIGNLLNKILPNWEKVTTDQ